MYDVIVIGAGPAGLFATYYCGLHKLNAVCLEALSYNGGQLANLYKDKLIYDIPGFAKITAGGFVAALEEQCAQFKDQVPIFHNQSVQKIEKNNEHFIITTDKDKYLTKTVLICAGGGEFKPRPLKLTNIEHFENIHYMAKTELYKDKHVVIFGGGDSAVDFALMLDDIGALTTLVHRRDDFRAHEHSLDLLRKSRTNILTPYNVVALEGEGQTAKTLTLSRAETNHELKMNADYFLVNYGFLPSSINFADWGVEATKDGIAVGSDTSASIAGIFAVGNCSVYSGKIKTIAVGLGEVPLAITAIKRYINPGKIIGTVYSSALVK